MFARATTWILGHRAIVFLLLLAVTCGLGFASTLLRVDITNDSFIASDDPSKAALDQFREDFGREDLFLLAVEGEVFSKSYLTSLAALHRDVASLEVDLEGLVDEPAADSQIAGFEGDTDWGDEGGTVVEETTSVINARRIRGGGDSLKVDGWFEPIPESEDAIARLAEEMKRSGGVGPRLVAKSERHSIVVVRTRVMPEQASHAVYDALVAVAKKHSKPGFDVKVSGIPATIVNVLRLTQKDTSTLLGLGLLVMMLVLAVIFRHWIGVIGPITVAIFAVVWTVGFMGAVGFPFTVLTNVLPLVILAVAISDSIHIQSLYRDNLHAGMDNDEAITAAVATAGPPCLLTSATTAIGLLSFQLSSLYSIREMGLAGAVGVMFAFLNSVVLLPIFLSFNRKSKLGRKPGSDGDWLDKILVGFRQLAARRRGTVLLAGGLITAGAIVAIATRTTVHHDPIEWLPSDNRAKVAAETINDEITGISTANLMVETKGESGVKRLELLRALERIEKRVLGYDEPGQTALVTHATSLLDVIRETNRAVNGPDNFRLPDQQGVAFDLLFLFEAAEREQLRRLATTDFARTHLSFNVRWEGPPRTDGLLAHIEKVIGEEVPPELATVTATGTIYTFDSIISNLLSDLLRTFGFAFLAIAILLFLLFRSLKLGLIAMVPNLLPIAVVLGGLAVASVPLDLVTVLAGSIVLGLVVDDTVHFFHHFDVAYRETGKTQQAIEESLNKAGRAIVITTIVMTLTFLMYAGAQISALLSFGMIVSGALVAALGFDLIVGPALLGMAYRTRSNDD